jgi:hypothetical protein
MDDWHAKRIAKGIRIKRLFNRDPKSKSSVRKLSGTKLTEQRMMPEGMASTLGVWTCNDRTILWFIKEKPLAIVIGNAEIAKGFRKQFDFLWELAGKK